MPALDSLAAHDGRFAGDTCALEILLGAVARAAEARRLVAGAQGAAARRLVARRRAQQDREPCNGRCCCCRGISRKESCARFSESGRHALCAATAAALSLATIASGLAYVRSAKLSLKWRRAGASE